MELAKFILIFSAVASLTSAMYYRSPYVVSRLTSSEENTQLESEPLGNSDNNVVKKAAVGDKNVSSTEENADKNEGSDLQGAASLQDYASASYPYSYYPFYIVDEGGKTVERPLINGQGSVSLPGLHLGATIGEGASHGGSAAAAAAAAAAVGGHGNHKPSESVHVEHGGGNGANFAAAGSIAGSFPPLPSLHVRPVHQTVQYGHPGQPVHYGGQVHYGGGVPVRPIYSHQGGHYSAAGGSSSGIHGIPVQYVGVGGYGSHGSHVHHVGGGSHGSNGVHNQPVYHVVGNHRPQVHVPVQHVNYKPTNHVRPPYSWSPPYSYHRDLEPFVVISGLPNIHAIGGFNYAEGATSGLGGIHTSQGNPVVISLPVVEGESPGLNNVAQLIQRPFQVIGSLLNPQVPEKPHKPTENHHDEHVHKPEQEHAHKPVHEPAHKPVHESVNKPVHEPVHKPVHETVHKPVHVTVQAVVHKPVETEHKPHYVTAESIHKPQYRPGHNKGEGVSQPTIKPTAGQFSKSNLANGVRIAPGLARSDPIVEDSKTAASEKSPAEEGSSRVKEEIVARADPNVPDLPSINSVDSVVGAEDKKEDLARSGTGSNIEDTPSSTTDEITVKPDVEKKPATDKTTTEASPADSGPSTVSSKKDN